VPGVITKALGGGESYRPEPLRVATYWRIPALRRKIAGPVIPFIGYVFRLSERLS